MKDKDAPEQAAQSTGLSTDPSTDADQVEKPPLKNLWVRLVPDCLPVPHADSQRAKVLWTDR